MDHPTTTRNIHIQEVALKLSRARSLIEKHNADGLLLRRVSSFAWATCGVASYVNTATTEGGASLLITRDHSYLATSIIEAPRFEQEANLVRQGWELFVSPWTDPMAALSGLTQGKKLIADCAYPGAKDVSPEIARLRAGLTGPEGERMRQLGQLCAQAMKAAVWGVKPGMTEYQIAGLLSIESQQRGVQPIVNLIATDVRIFHFRHPLPTEKKLERYAMLVLSGRKWGLVCSISRLIHFGSIPGDIQRRIGATIHVNAAFIAHTRPESSLGEIFRHGQAAYTAVGFSDEWLRHHQGGVVGYEPREYLATPDSIDQVSIGQALAWNPSIAGAKVEDTILVGAQENEILTTIPGWPAVTVQVPGRDAGVLCPQALEIR
jgi:Xaa-Pro aminopeptidase